MIVHKKESHPSLIKYYVICFSVEQQYNAYSGTVCLSKRWVSAHLLSYEIPSECIELLVAYLFITPAPYTSPR